LFSVLLIHIKIIFKKGTKENTSVPLLKFKIINLVREYFFMF
jgi:hypothetical protein